MHWPSAAIRPSAKRQNAGLSSMPRKSRRSRCATKATVPAPMNGSSTKPGLVGASQPQGTKRPRPMRTIAMRRGILRHRRHHTGHDPLPLPGLAAGGANGLGAGRPDRPFDQAGREGREVRPSVAGRGQ